MSSEIKKEDASNASGLLTLLETYDGRTCESLSCDRKFLEEQAVLFSGKKRAYISFVLGDWEMALPLSAVLEVGKLPLVTPLPHLPPGLQGIVQIRGEIHSVLDFVDLFELETKRHSLSPPYYLLFSCNKLKFCLAVERLTGIVYSGDRMGRRKEDEKDGLAALANLFTGIITLDRRRIFVFDDNRIAVARTIREWRNDMTEMAVKEEDHAR